MCTCVETINAELKPQGQTVNANMLGTRQAMISLIRTDKWTIENRRSKPNYVMATFCPFCGEKYPTSKSEAA